MLSKSICISLLTIATAIAMAQEPGPFCVPERFTSQYIYPEEDIVVQSDIEYALSENEDGEFEQQLLDIYTVDPLLDTMSHRPLAIILHGGGFKTGDKTDELVVESMLSLARSGYTAVTFNYRLGYDEFAGPCSADPDDIRRAVFRALQDAHAAMRFLFHNKDIYEIDTSFVFVGGLSAGATLASLIHYGTEEYFNENFSWLPLELGPINTSGNSLDDEFHVDGLIMAWGSFPPFLEITEDNVIPVITYHGAQDSIVPIGTGTFGSCPNYPMTVGPDLYIPQVGAAGACYDFNRNPDGAHGLTGNYSQFYVKNRSICFMKTIMCDVCESSQQQEGDPTCPELGLGFEEYSDLSRYLTLSPNPSNGNEIFLSNNDQGTLEVDIRILDVSGKAILEIRDKYLDQGRNAFNDLLLETGFYFVEIKEASGRIGVLRLVIE